MNNRNYNLNTRYGRRKARDQARYNYDNGTPEYRAETDKFMFYAKLVILAIMILTGAIIYTISGTEGLKSWLR